MLRACLQTFSFAYAVLAGLRGVLFSILNTRLMESLRCVARDAFMLYASLSCSSCISATTPRHAFRPSGPDQQYPRLRSVNAAKVYEILTGP